MGGSSDLLILKRGFLNRLVATTTTIVPMSISIVMPIRATVVVSAVSLSLKPNYSNYKQCKS